MTVFTNLSPVADCLIMVYSIFNAPSTFKYMFSCTLLYSTADQYFLLKELLPSRARRICQRRRFPNDSYY